MDIKTKTTTTFFQKNKTAIYIGGGILLAAGAAYAVFGYKGKSGNTLWGKWTKKPVVAEEEEKKPTHIPVKKEVLSISEALKTAICNKIPTMTQAELLQALSLTQMPLMSSEATLRAQLKQKIGCPA